MGRDQLLPMIMRLVPAVVLLGACVLGGCKGPGDNYCDALCACEDNPGGTSVCLDGCQEPLDADQKAAEAMGCGDPFEAALSCQQFHSTCDTDLKRYTSDANTCGTEDDALDACYAKTETSSSASTGTGS